eukprot:TRINITY_DN3097_c0_g1_i1.p2 TRINITY_DN3097_c0_g1~~TRINITY_DN3097_c0_g1_i1.p2  ORF type:complete len:282 (+),score=45.76 TRINITY_DN3097_c0_g1_i1:833-1678(+)
MAASQDDIESSVQVSFYDLHEFIDMEKSQPFYMNTKDKVAQEDPHQRVKAILDKGACKGQTDFPFGEDPTTLYGEGKMIIIHLEFTEDVIVQAMMIKAVVGKQFGSVDLGIYVDKDFQQIYEFGGLQRHDFKLSLLDTQVDGSKSILLQEWMPHKIRKMTLLLIQPVRKMMIEKMMVYGFPVSPESSWKERATKSPPLPPSILEEPWYIVMETAQAGGDLSLSGAPTTKSSASDRSVSEMEEGFVDINEEFNIVYPDVVEDVDLKPILWKPILLSHNIFTP